MHVGFERKPLPVWMRAVDSVVGTFHLGGGLLNPARLMDDAARVAGLAPGIHHVDYRRLVKDPIGLASIWV